MAFTAIATSMAFGRQPFKEKNEDGGIQAIPLFFYKNALTRAYNAREAIFKKLKKVVDASRERSII